PRKVERSSAMTLIRLSPAASSMARTKSRAAYWRVGTAEESSMLSGSIGATSSTTLPSSESSRAPSRTAPGLGRMASTANSALKNSSRKSSERASLMPTSKRQTLPAKPIVPDYLRCPTAAQPRDVVIGVPAETHGSCPRQSTRPLSGSRARPKGSALMTSANSSPAAGRYPAGARAFPHRSLLGIGHLETHEIHYLLDEAEQWVKLNRQPHKHTDRLAGLTIINAFFENSTRTLLSFEIAGKRLGADVVNMHAAQSSVKKGETLIDTAMTLNAMRVDAIVIRHGSSGAVQLIADKVACPVLNAGDGQHEHP